MEFPIITKHRIHLQDFEKINACFEFTKKHLSDINRRSGESYAEHCSEVAQTLQEAIYDPSLICVALLHDLLVHPFGETIMKEAPLTEKEKNLVRKMHILRRLHIDSNTEDLEQFFDAFTNDGEILVLRMAHRLNDVRQLENFEKDLQLQIATETLHMYTAIAGRLSMHTWRHEMEDVCFFKVYPTIADEVSKKFEAYKEIDEICMYQTQALLERKLKEKNIQCEIDNRVKTYYSTYRKMIFKNRQFDKLTDRLAIRIITETLEDCYKVLGIVHQIFNPIPGKLKDYIGAPKINGYQSIHTVIYPLKGVTEEPIEIQIRSKNMHRICEYGTAAHENYKNYTYQLKTNTSQIDLLRELQNLKEGVKSPKQFENALREYFHNDHIAVFDGENNLYHIKNTSTAADFIKTVHKRNHTSTKELRINGKKSEVTIELKDGDIVEAKF
ncbi:MAG: HD domain-containing protein [Candidatus Peregrinibacteria bacterium]|nr:HD domain-containing protein [Candidatus Peregrinibacteria bacterium]MDZ4244527.1 HD domain-containing protein [Candidatus Gracilibacteria bacterium]